MTYDNYEGSAKVFDVIILPIMEKHRIILVEKVTIVNFKIIIKRLKILVHNSWKNLRPNLLLNLSRVIYIIYNNRNKKLNHGHRFRFTQEPTTASKY